MNQALPPNLINISIADLNTALNEGVDFTSPEKLLTLWKFYSASTTFGNDPVAIRSRNLFWRLLNSPEKAREIDNLQLAGLWRRCQQDEIFVPFQLPDKFFLPTSIETSEGSSSSISRSQPGDEVPDHTGNQLCQSGPSTSSRASKRRSGVSIGSYEQEEISPRTSGSAGVSSRPSLRRNASSKGRTPTLAPNSRGRTRPSLPRRRSSQTRAQPSTALVSPRPALRSPNSGTAVTSSRLNAPAEGPREMPIRSNEPAFALPSVSSWQSVDESSELPPFSSTAVPAPRGSLVDRDFRRNFVDNQRHMSSSNLATLSRSRKTGSSVRFEEVPEVIGKGKDNEQAVSPSHGSAETGRRRGRSDSQVISDSEDSDGVTIPRVQSNLSKMIQKERKHSGGRELPVIQSSRSRDAHSMASREKDEEILEMGRKAGAPIIPKGRPGSDVGNRMRSPSPGATF